MSISAVETKMPNAIGVEVSGKALRVKLSDGRTVSIPVDQYPRLAYATKQEKNNWRIIGRGHGIHWQDLDEDISVEGLLAGTRSRESKSSLRRWLMVRRQPNFRPWKGKDYGKPNDFGLPVNLLILGESHYGDPGDWVRWAGQPTVGVVREYCEGGGYPFFTKIMRLILSPETSTETSERRTRFFDSVAFCNYVQCSVGDSPDLPPTDDMWKQAAGPFRTILESLRPTHILVCGMRLWDNMPDSGDFWTRPSRALVRRFDSVDFPRNSRSPKGRSLGCYRHSQDQEKSVVLAVHHPSRASGAWHPVVKRFLNCRAR